MILSFFRTVILYLVLMGAVRLMGKRQIGQLEPSEFVVAMLVADLAAIPMQDGSIPLLSGVVPILTILGLELVMAFLIMKSVAVRRFVCGKPVILVENGNILQENLRSTRVTLDELISHLRQKDVLDLKAVQYVILETDGNLSVFPYPKDIPASAREAGIEVESHYLPVTIIEDGYFSEENLQKAGKDSAWLRRILEEYKSTVDRTFLLTVDDLDKVVWLGKEGKQ